MENISTHIVNIYKTSFIDMTTYAEKLHELRKKLKLSQEEISTQVGISYRAYSSYERGDRKPSFELLEQLVNMYNVNLNWLIAGKGEIFNSSEHTIPEDTRIRNVVMQMRKEGLI